MSRPTIDWLPVFAQDETGYGNLIALVSQSHLACEGADEPHLKLGDLDGRTEGLIALTGGAEGALARLLAEGQDAGGYAEALVRLFPDRLYVEISRAGDPVEKASEAGLLRLAQDRHLPLVATNPVKFLDASYHQAHDALLCIAGSAYVEATDRPRSNPEHRLKSAAEMRALFADLPEAVANTLVVAQRCAIAAPSPRADPAASDRRPVG